MQKLYNVGIYTRLSVEDAFNSSKTNGINYLPADSSVSIENQKEILSKFVMLNGWIEKKSMWMTATVAALFKDLLLWKC